MSSSTDRYYEEQYSDVQKGGLLGLGNSLLDRAVERHRRRIWGRAALAGHRVVELGASSGEHLRFVRDDEFREWVALDLAPGRTDPELHARSSRRPGVRFVEGDAHQMPLEDGSADEVVATCILHHVRDPERVLEEARRVLRPGGSLIIALPTDPGLLNRAVKRVITFPKMRRAGLPDPRLVYARDHVNAIDRILRLHRHVHRRDRRSERYRPFPMPSWNLNLFIVLTAIRA